MKPIASWGGLVGLCALAAVGWALLPSPAHWIWSVALLGLGLVAVGWPPQRVLVRLGGLRWTREEFAQGFLITGGVGTGKTRSGLLALLHQVFHNDPHWGGLCLDEKANFHELLLGAARTHGREQDIILLGSVPNRPPAHRLNLVGDRLLSHETYSRLIVEVAVSLGQNREQTFFVKQAQTHIARAFDALATLEYEVTLDNAYRLLLDENELKSVLAELARRNVPQAASLIQHFQNQFLVQAPEQLSGVRGSIANFLDPYLPAPVAEVFCRDTTTPLSALNQGKIFCLTLPPQLAMERRYVATLLKLRLYQEAMLRYARPAAERARDNLLILWADEAQQFVATSDTLGDHNAVDRMREAGVAVVLATQSLNSFVPPLGKDKAEVLRLNLRNRLFFQAATEADAQDAADFLGKHLRRKVTWNVGRGGRSRSYVREEAHRVLPYVFRLLKNHECVVAHADKRFRRRMLPPLEADGRVSPWFPWWRKWIR